MHHSRVHTIGSLWRIPISWLGDSKWVGGFTFMNFTFSSWIITWSLCKDAERQKQTIGGSWEKEYIFSFTRIIWFHIHFWDFTPKWLLVWRFFCLSKQCLKGKLTEYSSKGTLDLHVQKSARSYPSSLIPPPSHSLYLFSLQAAVQNQYKLNKYPAESFTFENSLFSVQMCTIYKRLSHL